MKKPVRTTVFFGLLSALMVLPLSRLLTGSLGGIVAIKLVLWADLALYALLLCRWGKRPALSALFPLVLLLGAVLWPGPYAGFFLVVLAVISWIRSGICFTSTPLRSLFAEIATALGCGILIALWWPGSALAWASALWLFFLFQSLYFFFVPLDEERRPPALPVDSFESARQKLESLLENST